MSAMVDIGAGELRRTTPWRTLGAHARAAMRRHPWLVFFARRLLRLAVSLVIVLTGSFAMIHLIPGDPVRAALGLTATPAQVAARRHQLGLDQPLPAQYWQYVMHLWHGDMGQSLVSGEQVSHIIATRLPSTLQIAVLAFAVVLVVSFPVGVLAAACTRDGRRPRGELAFTSVTSMLGVVPEFVLAAALVAALAIGAGWFPAAGKSGPASYVLPVIALAAGPTAVLARIVRVEALKVLGEDYLRTARAKRLPGRLIYVRHAAPNTLTAFLTMAGNLLPAMIAGTVLVENVFAWPGLGSQIAQSVIAQDYSVVQGVVLVLGITVLAVNFVVDALLAVIDPRSTIRQSG